MNSNTKRLGVYLAIMLTGTSVATTLRAIACVKQLDYTNGFFANGSLISLANIIIAVTALGMLSYGFVASRIQLRPSFSTPATYVPTGILSVATVFLGARILIYSVELTSREIYGKYALSFKSPAVFLGVLAAVLAFVSIGYHFFNAFTVEGKTEIRAYFATANIIFLAIYAILIYLDGSISLNDSAKILRQTAVLLSALFFLYEARISLGREMWRIYTTFGLIAAILTAYTSIPAIITYYVNDVVVSSAEVVVSSAGAKSLASIEEYLLLLALFIFIISRLCLTAMLREDKRNELLDALGNYAKEREREATESFERYQEAFAAKQLSIFDLYGDDEPVLEEPEEAEACEPIVCEAEPDEPMISDDAIYEAIYGRMPDSHEPEAIVEKPEETEDDRDPMQIANDIFNTLDGVLGEEAEKDNEKEIDT